MNIGTINKSIIRAYDIRGVVDETLYPLDIEKIAYAFASELCLENNLSPTICVGYDGRLSSTILEKSLIKGLTEAGAKVIRIGLCPTPMLYYTSAVMQTDGAIMITGSHNPFNHNGLKIVKDNKPFFGTDLQNIAKQADQINRQKSKSKADIQDIDISEQYIKTLLDTMTSLSNLKIVWDPGNGAAGNVIKQLTSKLPGEHIVINAEIDGTFPNHHPDPTVKENMLQLINEVKKHKYDIGIAFDGDGDRIGVVDSQGRLLLGDQFILLFANDIAKEHFGAGVIIDVKTSQHIIQSIAQAGCTPILWKTGHSHIKSKMLETSALLAGEVSGHCFFRDKYFGYDDAIYAAMRLIDLLSRVNFTLDEFIDNLPTTYDTGETRIDCPDEIKFQIIDNINQHLSKEGISFLDLDGVRVNYHDGWWLLRASNTQPAIIIRCEATNKESFDKYLQQVRELLLNNDLKF